MLTQDACMFRGDAYTVYDSCGGVVLGSEEGDRIARALGPNGKGCILGNHGILTVGNTVDEAACLFTSMERTYQVQVVVRPIDALSSTTQSADLSSTRSILAAKSAILPGPTAGRGVIT